MIEPADIDLNLLVVFQEIYRQRQISSVARRLNLTQPTISNALARLRRTFGDELFVRTAQGMQPTPFADQLAEPVGQALQNIVRALNSREGFDAASSDRHFTIAMTDVGEIYFMPRLMELCGMHAPAIRISTVRASTVDLKMEMEAGKIDLAIGAFADVPRGLFQRRLFRQNYVTMFRKGHAFAHSKPKLDEFLRAGHLIVSSRESPYDAINEKLEKAGVSAAARFRVPHFTAVPYIVSTTDLVVTVPEKLAKSATAPFGLHYIRPPLRLPTLQTNIFWHRRFAQDEGNQWLRGFIAEHFREAA
jgi:DNA-binding transcriptional LysR family regulator